MSAGVLWKTSTIPVFANGIYNLASSQDCSILVSSVKNNGVYISRDSGSTWTLVSGLPNTGNWSSAVSVSADGQTMIVSSSTQGVYKSIDSGETWSLTNAPTTNNFTDVVMNTNGSRIVGLDSTLGLYNYNISGVGPGTRWVFQSTNTYTGIAASSDLTKVYISGNNIVYKSTDSGNSFTILSNLPTSYWHSVACSSNGSIVYLVGSKPADFTNDSGIVYKSTDSGATWTNIAPSIGWEYQYSEATKVLCSANGSVILLRTAARIITSTDSGATWSMNLSHNLANVAMSSDGTIMYCATYGSPVCVSTDSGATWNICFSIESINNLPGGPPGGAAADGMYNISCSANGSFVVLVIQNGGIYISQNTGTTWALLSSPDLPEVNVNYSYLGAIRVSNNGSVIAAQIFQNGPVYISLDGGFRWTISSVSPVTPPTNLNSGYNAFTGIVMNSTGTNMLALDYLLGPYKYSAPTGTEVQMFTLTGNLTQSYQGGWNAIAGSLDGTKLIAGGNQVLYTSSNSGSTWTLQSGGLPIEGITWNSLCCSSNGTIVYGTVSTLGIFKSTNSGVTWTQLPFTPNPEGETFEHVCCSSNGSVVLIASNTYAHVSTDGGATFTAARAATGSGVMCAMSSDGSVMYYSNISAGIWVSKNTGVTWASAIGELQNVIFFVACSADGATVISLCKDHSVVYISRDTGTTWTDISSTSPVLQSSNQQWTKGLAVSPDGNTIIISEHGGNGIYISVDSGGIKSWMSELAKRLSDPTDTSRPPFDTGSELVAGIVIVAGSPSPEKLAPITALLTLLFGGSADNPLLSAINSIEQLAATASAISFNSGMQPGPATESTSAAPSGFDATMTPSTNPVC